MIRSAFIVLFLTLTGCRDAERPPVPPVEPPNVAEVIAEIDAMRSGLAKTLDQDLEPTAETFARVCKPVGMRMKLVAEEKGWIMRQIAVKYRNPDHAADPESEAFFVRFESDASLDSLWTRTERNGVAGRRYLRRITVEPACLACHGPKDARPDFVVEKYPDDRAFDFEPGDLRGLYSVFVPDEDVSQ